jgi:hypothetical protein
MSENLTRAQYEVVLRHDFVTFAMRCFQDLNPQTDLAMNWHLEVIAAKLTAVREGKIRRLIINKRIALISFDLFSIQRRADAPLRPSTAVGWNEQRRHPGMKVRQRSRAPSGRHGRKWCGRPMS